MARRTPRPDLTVDRILGWADAHHARTGRWPVDTDGPVADAPGETWHAIGSAARLGRRGGAGGGGAGGDVACHRLGAAPGLAGAAGGSLAGTAAGPGARGAQPPGPARPDGKPDPGLGPRPPPAHGCVAGLAQRPHPGDPG